MYFRRFLLAPGCSVQQICNKKYRPSILLKADVAVLDLVRSNIVVRCGCGLTGAKLFGNYILN
jgi:hypothetical protein